MKIGDRVRHTYRGYDLPCETGVAVDIINNPPRILVKLDEEFVTAGNDGFMTAACDQLIKEE